MITDALLNAISAVPLMLLSLLPDITLSIPSNVFDWIITIGNSVGYLLPIKSILPILGIMITVNVLKISWAILLRVKSFIPTMGA